MLLSTPSSKTSGQSLSNSSNFWVLRSGSSLSLLSVFRRIGLSRCIQKLAWGCVMEKVAAWSSCNGKVFKYTRMNNNLSWNPGKTFVLRGKAIRCLGFPSNVKWLEYCCHSIRNSDAKSSNSSTVNPVRLRNCAAFFLILSSFMPIVIVSMDCKYM